MKKFLSICLIVVSLFMFVGCEKKEEEKVLTEAQKFKNDYESLNGKENASGVEFRSVNIDENNPFIHVEAKDIVKKVENKETFLVYFGDKQCPWCRSVIETFIKVSNSYNYNKVYYVNIWDDDHNEILRDKYIINDNGKLELSVEGTSEYKSLLEYFDKVLPSYTLTDSKGKKVDTKEKRIYAPQFIYVENGEAKYMIEGTSKLQDGAYSELTKEIKEDQEKILNEFFDKFITKTN